MSTEGNQLENMYFKILQRMYWNLITGRHLLWGKVTRSGNLEFPGTISETPITVPT